eukprot:89083_1
MIMFAKLAVLATIATITNSETLFPNYQILSTITLPATYNGLQGHITALYGDKIYLFGGKNLTDSSSGTFTTNTRFWEMDISGWSSLSVTETNDDISSEPEGTWVEITDSVTLPTYGSGIDGEFYCEHQCFALLDNMLYIMAPFANDDDGNSYAGGSDMYRLDLSTLEFENNNTFNSNMMDTVALGYDGGICVTTDGTDIYYMMGYYDGLKYGLIKYDVENNQHVALTDALQSRRFASCAFNLEGTRIYVFGGRTDSAVFGQKEVDWYDMESETC